MKLYLPLAFTTFAKHSFAAPSLRGQEQESSSVSSLTSSFSGVGTGLCRDDQGKNYDRATFSGVDTRNTCESTCAPLGGNSKLVGYEYSDTLNICSCRFTEGYINTSQLGGVGNCPSGAYADWGGEACKVVPSSQGGSGIGRVTQAGGDSRFDCFRNEKFAIFICEQSPLYHGSRLQRWSSCPLDGTVKAVSQLGLDWSECENWCTSQGVGCCYYAFTSDGSDYCRWRGYANRPVHLVHTSDDYRYASIICDKETELDVQNMIK